MLRTSVTRSSTMRLGYATSGAPKATSKIIDGSGRISEVLAVQSQLSSVREEIDKLASERAALAHRVNYATLDVHLASAIVPPRRNRPSSCGSIRLGVRRRMRSCAGAVIGPSLGPSRGNRLGSRAATVLHVTRPRRACAA